MDRPFAALARGEGPQVVGMARRERLGMQQVEASGEDLMPPLPLEDLLVDVVDAVRRHGIGGADGHDAALGRHEIAPEMALLAAHERREELVVPLRIALHVGVDAQVEARAQGRELLSGAVFEPGLHYQVVFGGLVREAVADSVLLGGELCNAGRRLAQGDSLPGRSGLDVVAEGHPLPDSVVQGFVAFDGSVLPDEHAPGALRPCVEHRHGNGSGGCGRRGRCRESRQQRAEEGDEYFFHVFHVHGSGLWFRGFMERLRNA